MIRKLTSEELEILEKYQASGALTMILTGDRNLLEFYGGRDSIGNRASYYLQIGRKPGRPFADIRKFYEYNIADLIRDGSMGEREEIGK